ncbi:hypothetical protein GIB67_041095, partial [Kingdonia uniflora]
SLLFPQNGSATLEEKEDDGSPVSISSNMDVHLGHQRIDMDHSIEVDSANPSAYSIKTKVISPSMPFRSAQIRLVSGHHEVYEPCDDSFALVDALLADRANLLEHQPMFCMEVGCGSGYVITSLAIMLGQENAGIHYFATDTNPHAARVTCETLEAHGVHAEVISDNIASAMEKRLEGLVDVMVVNPPYVPTPEDEVGCDGIASAWAGGENGRTVIDKILPVADKLLSEKGWLYMVTLAANNPSQICRSMRENGYASRIIVQRSTEEESLHVIKFWRDSDGHVGGKESTTSTTVIESLFSQLHRLSFWKNGSNN